MQSLNIIRNPAFHFDNLTDRWFRIAILGVMFLIIQLTLSPYDFQTTRIDGALSIRSVWQTFLEGESHPMDMRDNVILYIPFGFSLAIWILRRRQHTLYAAIYVIAASFLLSLTIELTQVFLPSRFPSPVDVLMNSLGAFTGFWLFLSSRFLISSVYALITGLSIYIILAFSTAVALQSFARLDDWNKEYHLIIGNELTGNRPWQGVVFDIQMADRIFSPSESQNVFREDYPERPIDQAVLAYTFTQDQTASPKDQPELIWQRTPLSPINDGKVVLDKDSWLISEVPPVSAIQHIRETSEFSLIATVASAEPMQSGPARIVSLSNGTSERNFTIGQQDDDLIIRLRTPISGVNGAAPEMTVPDVFAIPDQKRRLLITYNRPTITVYVDTIKNAYSFRLRPEPMFFQRFLGVDAASPVNNESMDIFRLLYHCLIFIPVGLWLVLWLRILRSYKGRKQDIKLFIAAITASVLALESFVVFIGGSMFDFGNVTIGVIITASAVWFFSRRLMPASSLSMTG